MIDTERAFDLAKAARVLLDEAELMGLGYSLDIDVTRRITSPPAPGTELVAAPRTALSEYGERCLGARARRQRVGGTCAGGRSLGKRSSERGIRPAVGPRVPVGLMAG